MPLVVNAFAAVVVAAVTAVPAAAQFRKLPTPQPTSLSIIGAPKSVTFVPLPTPPPTPPPRVFTALPSTLTLAYSKYSHVIEWSRPYSKSCSKSLQYAFAASLVADTGAALRAEFGDDNFDVDAVSSGCSALRLTANVRAAVQITVASSREQGVKDALRATALALRLSSIFAPPSVSLGVLNAITPLRDTLEAAAGASAQTDDDGKLVFRSERHAGGVPTTINGVSGTSVLLDDVRFDFANAAVSTERRAALAGAPLLAFDKADGVFVGENNTFNIELPSTLAAVGTYYTKLLSSSSPIRASVDDGDASKVAAPLNLLNSDAVEFGFALKQSVVEQEGNALLARIDVDYDRSLLPDGGGVVRGAPPRRFSFDTLKQVLVDLKADASTKKYSLKLPRVARGDAVEITSDVSVDGQQLSFDDVSNKLKIRGKLRLAKSQLVLNVLNSKGLTLGGGRKRAACADVAADNINDDVPVIVEVDDSAEFADGSNVTVNVESGSASAAVCAAEPLLTVVEFTSIANDITGDFGSIVVTPTPIVAVGDECVRYQKASQSNSPCSTANDCLTIYLAKTEFTQADCDSDASVCKCVPGGATQSPGVGGGDDGGDGSGATALVAATVAVVLLAVAVVLVV